jgi:hypothetical protein
MQEDKDPYSNYDLDDWQWEFLRRNPRYLKAYKASEWLKKRLNNKKEKQVPRFWIFTAFGVQCAFRWISSSSGYKGWVYDGSSYRTKTRQAYRNDAASGSFLDLPSPSASSEHYKKKFLRKGGPVHQIYNDIIGEEPWDVWTPSLLKEYEIAVEIDTRYALDEIQDGVREVISSYKSNNRHHVRLYPDYLAVWDLRREGLTDTQIAEKLWPEDYETIGGRDCDTGEKGSLMQRVHDYEKAAKKLIENSFPPKKRSPKIKK